MSEKHNGWTNYATWRINFEMFDGDDPTEYGADDVYELADRCKEQVEWYLEETSSGCAYSYAMAFINDVNWQEIAEYMAEEHELFKKEEK